MSTDKERGHKMSTDKEKDHNSLLVGATKAASYNMVLQVRGK